jgi:hypothetical protein
MNPRTAFLALGLALLISASLIPATCTRAQSPRDPEVIRLKREIAQARAMIAKWTQALQALEGQLDRAEAGPPGLRFPVDVERAMIGQGLEASQRLRPQSAPSAGQSRGGFMPPR